MQSLAPTPAPRDPAPRRPQVLFRVRLRQSWGGVEQFRLCSAGAQNVGRSRDRIRQDGQGRAALRQARQNLTR
jgi:hypothetical protein